MIGVEGEGLEVREMSERAEGGNCAEAITGKGEGG